MHNRTNTLVAVLIATSLAACGGGGGDAPTATPAPAPSPVVVAPAPAPAPVVQTTVPTPVYADAKALSSFNRLNELRSSCGLGKLAQNTALDTAVANHIQYSVVHGALSHVESQGLQGFTGVNATDRAAAAGLPVSMVANSVNETIVPSSTVGGSLHATIAAPYHALAALGAYKYVGIGVRSDFEGTQSETHRLVASYAFDAPQAQSTALTTFPCEGTVLAVRGFAGEIPEPTKSLGVNAGAGAHPVLVQSQYGTVLKITKATVSDLATLRVLPMVGTGVLTQQNDLNGILKSHQAAVIPEFDSLEAGKSYKVEIEASINNVAQPTRTFVFSVASDAVRK